MFEEYPPLLSVAQCCDILSVEKHSIYKLIATQKLDGIRVGEKVWRIPKESLIYYVLNESGITIDKENVYDYI